MGFFAAIPLIAQAGAGAAAGETERASTVEGARAQANIEKMSRDFAKERFEKDLERQEPFLEAGREALPELVAAIQNQSDVTNLPGFTTQQAVRNEFLGETPAFIKERADQALEAFEGEKNKGRLLDLVNIGLGSAGSAGQTRVNLGSQVGRSLGQVGNIQAQALQDAAVQRQNTINQLGESLSGLPAYYAAQNAQKKQPQTF